MKYNLRMIENKIANHNVLHGRYCPSMKLCRGLRIWEHGNEKIDNDQIYILTSSLFYKAIQEEKVLPSQIICIFPRVKESTIHKNIQKISDDVSVLFLENIYSDQAWFNILSEILNDYEKNEEKLIDAFMNKQPLEDILDICEEMIENPLGLFNENLRLLGKSSGLDSGKSPNRFWREANTLQFVSEELITHLKEKRIIATLKDAKTSLLIDLEDGTKPYMTCNLFVKETKVGSVSLFPVYKDISQADGDLLCQIAKILAFRVEEKEFENNKDYTRKQMIIADLLKGKWFSKETMNRAMQGFPYDIEEGAMVLLLQDFRYEEIIEIEQEIEQALCQELMIERQFSISTEKGTVLIHPCGHNEREQLNLLTKNKKFQTIRCGCSMKFYAWEDLYQQYLFAIAAVKLGRQKDPNQFVYLYENYALYHRVSILDEQIEIRHLCLPQIWALYRYDVQTQNELAESVYYYLIYGKSLEQASKKLNIHKSTLVYRLKKAQDIAFVDLDNGNLRQLVILSCEIILYTKHIKKFPSKI